MTKSDFECMVSDLNPIMNFDPLSCPDEVEVAGEALEGELALVASSTLLGETTVIGTISPLDREAWNRWHIRHFFLARPHDSRIRLELPTWYEHEPAADWTSGYVKPWGRVNQEWYVWRMVERHSHGTHHDAVLWSSNGSLRHVGAADMRLGWKMVWMDGQD